MKKLLKIILKNKINIDINNILGDSKEGFEE